MRHPRFFLSGSLLLALPLWQPCALSAFIMRSSAFINPFAAVAERELLPLLASVCIHQPLCLSPLKALDTCARMSAFQAPPPSASLGVTFVFGVTLV
jgi:hypothetical protein